MSVSLSFRSFTLEQLGRATPEIRARSMFGGVGIYAGDLFFALLDDDTLYFKVDESTRPQFEGRSMAPFRPYGEAGVPLLPLDAPSSGSWRHGRQLGLAGDGFAHYPAGPPGGATFTDRPGRAG